MATREQERAAFAWESVQGQGKDYRNLVKSAPAMVMSNGLMQTLAFLKGKGSNHHIAVLNHILGWLHQKEILNSHEFANAMNNLYGLSSFEYQRATDEALAILKWLRHLADAVIADNGAREGEGGQNA